MAFYGPDQMTLGMMEYVKSELLKVPGAKFYGLEDVGDEAYLHTWHRITAGIPVSECVIFWPSKRYQGVTYCSAGKSST
jgi:hypothetical protein